ncbi:hypothetical protein UFOVP1655_141 [uncultured Caudovirales phage]|uniref:Uncharacterized protein n=1 Tax=uncultured Caudovirales phage TaxID=2100421 RepID=A0A6J5T6A1_9CAUD|nr:hypothetical protein UFOVP1655_141 [uncultured Caudovirales phage]
MMNRYKIELELKVEGNINSTWLEEAIGIHLNDGGGEHVKVVKLYKEPIGANVKIKWIDETFHPEHEVETSWVHFSFSKEPTFDDSVDDLMVEDQYGIRDYDIFFYVDKEKGLQELMEYPNDNSYVILDYKLVYSIQEVLDNKNLTN